jgi:hypothetical protein
MLRAGARGIEYSRPFAKLIRFASPNGDTASP